jgi:UDP-N-acetylmuramate-alanine ligase
MEFWDAFGETLRTCDHLIIYDIYAARENLTDLKKLFTQRHFDDIHTIEDL